jgi:hypothetical protein
MKKIVCFLLVLIAFSVVGFAQETLENVVATVINPPKIAGMSLTEAFSTVSTYVAAVVVLCSVFVVKYIPGLNTVFETIKPYFRAITIGVAVIWVLLSYGKLSDTQAGISFVLSNLFYELIKLVPKLFKLNTEDSKTS